MQGLPVHSSSSLQLSQGLPNDPFELGGPLCEFEERVGGSGDEGLIGHDVVEVALPLEEEAAHQQPHDGRGGVEVIEVRVQELQLGSRGATHSVQVGVVRQLDFGALQAEVGRLGGESPQGEHVLHLFGEGVEGLAFAGEAQPDESSQHDKHYTAITVISRSFINLQMQTRNKQRLLSQQPRTNAVQNASAAYTDTHLLPRKPSLPQQEVDRRKAISKIGGEYAQTPLFDKSVGILPLLNAPHLPGLPPPRLPMVAARMSQQRLAQREAATPQREPNASLLERREESKEESKAERPKKHHRVPTIFLTRGNNSPILREVLVEQAGWHEAVHREHANMCWLQAEMQKSAGWHSTGSLVQERLFDAGKQRSETVIFNYLEGQVELTNKDRLYRNLKRTHPDAIGKYVPITYLVDFRQDAAQVQESLTHFLSHYFKRTVVSKLKPFVVKNYFMEIGYTRKQLARIMEQSQSMTTEQPTSEKLWILKPASLNRGRGIHVFSSLKQLGKLLSETSFQISVRMYSESIKPQAYIIQQYIEKPLLLEGYKFDIRIWVLLLVTKSHGKKQLKIHLFRQGYARLASLKYVIHEEEVQHKTEESPDAKSSPEKSSKKMPVGNRFMHLTNNAVQKDAEQYGSYCEGNQLALDDVVSYFKAKDPTCPLTLEKLVDQMGSIVAESISTVKDKLTLNNPTKTFQLLGYDFLLDWEYKLWLIEANCNPCLEESSALLGKLLRQMLSGLASLCQGEQTQPPGWQQLA